MRWILPLLINIQLSIYLWWGVPHVAVDGGVWAVFSMLLCKMLVHKTWRCPLESLETKGNIFSSLLHFACVLLAAACCQQAGKKTVHSRQSGAVAAAGLFQAKCMAPCGQERATKPWQFHGVLVFYQRNMLCKSLIAKSLKSLKFVDV